MEGISGIAVQGTALAGKLGLQISPAPDPLASERAGRARPDAFVAAHAVASAVRHLAEREAAFPARDTLKTAFDMGAPVAVAAVEQSIAMLADATLRAERKPERLAEGMDEQLALEQTLDLRSPSASSR